MPTPTPESIAIRKIADRVYKTSADWAEGGSCHDPADRGSSWAVQAMTINDASLLHQVADAIEGNDPNAAQRVIWKMDTACRDHIPDAIYTALMGWAGE